MSASFDPSLVAAKIALNLIHPEDPPACAGDALVAGYDGPIIRRVAALLSPSGWEVDQLLTSFLSELGVNKATRSEAAQRVAYEFSREILDGHSDSLFFLDRFYRLWIESGYVSEVAPLGYLEDDIYVQGLSEDEARREVRDTLIRFVRQYEEPE